MKYKRIFFPDPADTKGEKHIMIATPIPFNLFTIFLWAMIPACIYLMIIHFDVYDYRFVGACICCALFIAAIWQRFTYINTLRIDLEKKLFTISTRNPFKFFFAKPITVYFKDIKHFEFADNYPWRSYGNNFYQVSAIIEESFSIPFIEYEKKKTAEQITAYLNKTISL